MTIAEAIIGASMRRLDREIPAYLAFVDIVREPLAILPPIDDGRDPGDETDNPERGQ